MNTRPIAARRPTGAQSIGRRTSLGNPYKTSQTVSNAQAVRLYRLWIMRPAQAELRAKIERRLSGARLWCPGCRGKNPAACHGSVIADIVCPPPADVESAA